MGSSDRRRKSRSRKRTFKGNQHNTTVVLTTNNPPVDDQQPSSSNVATEPSTTTAASASAADSAPPPSVTLSASAKKLKLDLANTEEESPMESIEIEHDCYIFFSTNILKNIVEDIGKCPNCSSDVNFVHDNKSKKGLCHFFCMSCISCDWTKTVSSSKQLAADVKAVERGRKPYDVNIRSAIAFREMGRGHSAIEKFCGVMNMPPPMNSFSFEKTVRNVLHKNYLATAEESMKRGAEEAVPEKFHVPSDDVKPVTVSFDGTWQRRGYASLNGVVTALCQGKCIDIVGRPRKGLLHMMIGKLTTIVA